MNIRASRGDVLNVVGAAVRLSLLPLVNLSAGRHVVGMAGAGASSSESRYSMMSNDSVIGVTAMAQRPLTRLLTLTPARGNVMGSKGSCPTNCGIGRANYTLCPINIS